MADLDKTANTESCHVVENQGGQKPKRVRFQWEGGTRGLIVVLTGCMVQTFTAGFFLSLGVFYVGWQERFSAGAAEVAWTGSLTSFSTLCIGPVAAAFARQFGCRPVVIAGGALGSTCVILASQTSSLAQLTFFLFIAGFGFGLTYHPSVFILNFIFKARLALAYGIAYAGFAIGTMAMPPVMQLLTDKYGWQGTMFIFAAILAHLCVAGALLRPTYREKKQIKGCCSKKDRALDDSKPKHGSNIQMDVVNPDQLNSCRSNVDTDEVNIEKDQQKDREKTEKDCDNPLKCGQVPSTDRRPTAATNDTCDAEQVTYKGGSLWSISFTSLTLNLIKSFNFSLFKNFRFLGLCVVNLLFGISFYAALIFIVPRAISVGISDTQAALLSSISGACSLVSRLTYGFFIDAKIITPIKMCALASLVNAISCFICPLTQSFGTMSIFAASFGASNGVYGPLVTVVATLYVKPSQNGSAFGWMMLFLGTGSILGALLVGRLFDITGSYNTSYYIAGGAACIVLIIFLCDPLLKRLQDWFDGSHDDIPAPVPSSSNALGGSR